MHNRRPGHLSGATAQRVLDGGDGPAPLPQLIAAATAPATAAELHGESAARAAFRSVHPAPLPDIPRRTPVRVTTSMMIAKAIAAIALTTGTAGGIALATTSTPTDADTRTTIESAASADTASSSFAAVTPTPTATPAADADADGDGDGVTDADAASGPDGDGTAARKSPQAQAPHETGRCRALSNITTDGHPGKAAISPAFTGLSCADADADADEAGADEAATDRAAGRPSVAPGNPEQRTGKPDGVGRATNDTDGDDAGEEAEKAEERGGAGDQEADRTRGRSEDHRQDG